MGADFTVRLQRFPFFVVPAHCVSPDSDAVRRREGRSFDPEPAGGDGVFLGETGTVNQVRKYTNVL